MEVKGDCHASCGACCRIIGIPDLPYELHDGVLITDMIDNPTDRWVEFLKARGSVEDGKLSIKYRTDVKEPIIKYAYGPKKLRLLLVKSICPKLNEDSSCQLHGPAKPEVCKTYPTVYDDLSIVPECTYKIE